MNDEILLTKEGYDKIVAEHEELVSVRRAEVAERIKNRRILIKLHRLQHMGVSRHDHITAQIHQPVAELHHPLFRLIAVFPAPVDKGENDIASGLGTCAVKRLQLCAIGLQSK